jgi:hypothetical protein
MFLVSEEAAAAIRSAYLEKGEWPAVAELRRFYKIDDNDAALRTVRTIASWLPAAEVPPTTRRPARKRPTCLKK